MYSGVLHTCTKLPACTCLPEATLCVPLASVGGAALLFASLGNTAVWDAKGAQILFRMQLCGVDQTHLQALN